MRLTGIQLMWITSLFQPYYIMGYAIQQLGQDAWIGMSIGAGISFVLTWVIYLFTTLFKNHTIVWFSKQIFRRWFTLLIVIPYICSWLCGSVAMIHESIDYTKLALLPRTPALIILMLLMLASLYLAVSGGITSIGRYTEIIGPLFLMISFIPLFMTPMEMDWRWLQPVMTNTSLVNLLQTSYVISTQMAEPSLLLFILVRFVSNSQRVLSMTLLGTGIQAVYMVIGTVSSILLFGPQLGGHMTFPPLAFLKTISLLDFIQNIDVFAAMIWLPHYVAITALFIFISSFALSEVFSMDSSWKRITVALACGVTVLVVASTSMVSLNQTYRLFWAYWAFPVTGIALPLGLWLARRISILRAST